jgi:hypothetical protein
MVAGWGKEEGEEKRRIGGGKERLGLARFARACERGIETPTSLVQSCGWAIRFWARRARARGQKIRVDSIDYWGKKKEEGEPGRVVVDEAFSL